MRLVTVCCINLQLDGEFIKIKVNITVLNTRESVGF